MFLKSHLTQIRLLEPSVMLQCPRLKSKIFNLVFFHRPP